ncbi:hypothetical protein SUDANB120_02073 [Streptomyces sp. enrichment culture]|uniref:hypothetical protein n=1 Tax=Streptomyces sp. enrichment culture TaxID=1795815 RepID=UPI003F5632E1
MRRRTARVLTATALTAAAVACQSAGAAGFAPGDFAVLEVWPKKAAPGAAVTANTTACGSDGHADGDATMVGGGRFKLVPGTHEEVVVGQFRVAGGTRPGTYAIGATCANGKYATGNLEVTERGPQGRVRTGVGGGATTAADPAKVTAGAAVLAAAAVGGTWLLRRRASGTQG